MEDDLTSSRKEGLPVSRLSLLTRLALLLAGSWFTGTAAARAPDVEVLRLEQAVTGLPDLAEGQSLRQRLTLDLVGRRVLLEMLPGEKGARKLALSREGASRILLRLDFSPPLIHEIIDDRKMFRSHEGDLNHLQDDRDIQEMNEIRLARRLPAAERDKLLRDSHLRLDGKRVVEMTTGGTKEILGHECRKVTLTENGRVVIEAWMAEALPGGPQFYELYSHLGTFSQEVLEEAKKLRGLPLEAHIRVVTAAPTFQIHAKTTRLELEAKVKPEFFDLPVGYRKIEEVPPLVACPVCGSEVERDEPAGGQIRLPEGVIHFNTPKCKKEFIQLLRKSRSEAIRKAREARQGKKPSGGRDPEKSEKPGEKPEKSGDSGKSPEKAPARPAEPAQKS